MFCDFLHERENFGMWTEICTVHIIILYRIVATCLCSGSISPWLIMGLCHLFVSIQCILTSGCVHAYVYVSLMTSIFFVIIAMVMTTCVHAMLVCMMFIPLYCNVSQACPFTFISTFNFTFIDVHTQHVRTLSHIQHTHTRITHPLTHTHHDTYTYTHSLVVETRKSFATQRRQSLSLQIPNSTGRCKNSKEWRMHRSTRSYKLCWWV